MPESGSLQNDFAELYKRIDTVLYFSSETVNTLNKIKDMLLAKQTSDAREAHPNPLTKFGKKCFSQTDEDGITLEIIRRLDLKPGLFAEFGVGNGLENNTLILAALGWDGFWVGGEDLAFRFDGAKHFAYTKDWITLENISAHATLGMRHFGRDEIDVIGLDLDGNDLFLVEDLLSNGFLPKLFIVEYNGKFPPPIRFTIDYDANHIWRMDNYFGASLCSFVDLFEKFGYTLICCNSHSGANAFFIRNELMNAFADVPRDIDNLYVPLRNQLYAQFGHRASVRLVETILNRP